MYPVHVQVSAARFIHVQDVALVRVHVLLEDPEHGVITDNVNDRNVFVLGRPQRLHRSYSGAITDHRHNRPVRIGTLGAYGSAHPVEAPRVAYRSPGAVNETAFIKSSLEL